MNVHSQKVVNQKAVYTQRNQTLFLGGYKNLYHNRWKNGGC